MRGAFRSTVEGNDRDQISAVPVGVQAGDLIGGSKPPAAVSDLSPSFLTRNSSVAMAGGVVSQGLKFLVVIYIARRFSPTEFGWFSFAIAVNAYIFIISHFGLPVFGTRVVSKSGSVSRDLLQEIVCIRMFLALAATAVSVCVFSLAPKVSHTELLLVALFGLSNVPLAGLFDWVFQGLHRQEVSAILNILWQAGWLGFTALGVALGARILAVAIALGASATLASVAGLVWLQRTHGVVRDTRRDASLLARTRSVLYAAAPLGWGTMLISVMVWTDTICVRLLRGELAVGIYAAGNRAALALSMLGTFYVQGAFPLLSRSSDQDPSSFERCFTQNPW